MWRRSLTKSPKRQKFTKIKNFTFFFKTVAVGTLMLALIFSLLNSGFFRIQSVETIWDRDDFYDPAVAEFLEKQFLQKNIFLTWPNHKTLQQNFPNSIKNFSVTKKLPHSLRFNLVTRQPILFLSTLSESLKSASVSALVNIDGLNQNKLGPEGFWSDAEGFIFNQKVSSLSSLPKALLDDEKIRVLKKSLASEFFFHFFLEYQQLSQEKGLPGLSILSLTANEEIIVRLENGTYLILPGGGNLTDLLTTLDLILNKYAIEGHSLKKVDLRFKNPVVEFR